MLGPAQRIPLRGGHARGVEHVAQTQHGGGAASAEVREHRAQLAVDAEGVAIGDEQVRVQRGEGRVDGGAAQVAQGLGVHAEGAGAVAAAHAGHARQHQPVPAFGERVTAGIGVAGDEQAAHAATGQGGKVLRQRIGEGAIAPRVAQTHGVVGVQRDRGVHRGLLVVR